MRLIILFTILAILILIGFDLINPMELVRRAFGDEALRGDLTEDFKYWTGQTRPPHPTPTEEPPTPTPTEEPEPPTPTPTEELEPPTPTPTEEPEPPAPTLTEEPTEEPTDG
jgi:outer membrane biosynthesis protein TonB